MSVKAKYPLVRDQLASPEPVPEPVSPVFSSPAVFQTLKAVVEEEVGSCQQEKKGT
jgi:hypothetical protein